jgi:hypothetical protein
MGDFENFYLATRPWVLGLLLVISLAFFVFVLIGFTVKLIADLINWQKGRRLADEKKRRRAEMWERRRAQWAKRREAREQRAAERRKAKGNRAP